MTDRLIGPYTVDPEHPKRVVFFAEGVPRPVRVCAASSRWYAGVIVALLNRAEAQELAREEEEGS